MIQTLIDKYDSFEVIRDQIAAILVTESANQMSMASAAGKDPSLWKLRVYTERANPWEAFLNVPVTDDSPIINIRFDSTTFDQSSSNVLERQKSESVFDIEFYGYGRTENTPGGGHKPGDREAALAVQRAIRLSRNILMASEYTYLGLRGAVWKRWPQSVTAFQPQIDAQNVQKISAARMKLEVHFNEFSPQYVAETLEYLAIDVKRKEDGEVILTETEMSGDLEMTGDLELSGGKVLLEADYDYTDPTETEMSGDLEMTGDLELYGEG